MKIRLVTYFDSKLASIGRITAAILREYALRHGYQMFCQTSTESPSQTPSWNKVALVRQLLNNSDCDWLMWLDADAIVMNPEIKLESLIDRIPAGKDITFATDQNGLSAGVFIVRNSQWSISFLDTVWFLRDINHEFEYGKGGAKWEQNCIKGLIKHFKSVSDRVHLLPQQTMNSYEDTFLPGDFILHLASCPNERRLSKLTQLFGTQVPCITSPCALAL